MSFEKSLQDKLQRIFKLKRVDFSLPSESQEQDVLFIEVDRADVKVKDKKQVGTVTGTIRTFGDQGKFPHGYFGRAIGDADPDLTRDLHFSQIDESAGTYRDHDVRSARFVYFFSSQYDPEQGTITSIDINIEVSE